MATYKDHIGVTEITAYAQKAYRSRKFRSAWKEGDIYKMYDYAVTICPDMTFAKFDDCWQWRTCLHKSYREAANEFAHCLAGIK